MSDASLDSELHAAALRASESWPGVELPVSEFVAELRALVRASPDSLAALRQLREADLFLAKACARGLASAHRAFDAKVLPKAREAIGRIDSSSGFVDDVLAQLRVRLLLPADGAAPRIGQFAGSGSLVNWVRAAALRVAINLRTPPGKNVGLDEAGVLELPTGSGADVELTFIRREHQAAFKACFEEATTTLSPRDRNVLRLHFVDGLNIDQLGALHGVHRSTVARWIASSREALFVRTRRLLEERLRLPSAELEEVLGLIQSNVELSLNRMLATASE